RVRGRPRRGVGDRARGGAAATTTGGAAAARLSSAASEICGVSSLASEPAVLRSTRWEKEGSRTSGCGCGGGGGEVVPERMDWAELLRRKRPQNPPPPCWP